jgi:hypothetical protein
VEHSRWFKTHDVNEGRTIREFFIQARAMCGEAARRINADASGTTIRLIRREIV